MQFAKDSFYMALRGRLAALNPARLVLLDGVERAAVIVTENEAISSAKLLPDTFYIEWGACQVVAKHREGGRPLMGMDCLISYRSTGTCTSGVDRGRVLGELDSELLSICHPSQSRKRDFTQSPSADLGTNIFWSFPEFGKLQPGDPSHMSAEGLAAGYLQRGTSLTVFFFPEVDLS